MEGIAGELNVSEFEEWLLAHPDLTFTACSASDCPLAQWLTERQGRHYFVTTQYLLPEGGHSEELPSWMTEFVRAFDRQRCWAVVEKHEAAVAALNTVKEQVGG